MVGFCLVLEFYWEGMLPKGFLCLVKVNPEYESILNHMIGLQVVVMYSDVWKIGGFFKGLE